MLSRALFRREAKPLTVTIADAAPAILRKKVKAGFAARPLIVERSNS